LLEALHLYVDPAVNEILSKAFIFWQLGVLSMCTANIMMNSNPCYCHQVEYAPMKEGSKRWIFFC